MVLPSGSLNQAERPMPGVVTTWLRVLKVSVWYSSTGMRVAAGRVDGVGGGGVTSCRTVRNTRESDHGGGGCKRRSAYEVAAERGNCSLEVLDDGQVSQKNVACGE